MTVLGKMTSLFTTHISFRTALLFAIVCVFIGIGTSTNVLCAGSETIVYINVISQTTNHEHNSGNNTHYTRRPAVIRKGSSRPNIKRNNSSGSTLIANLFQRINTIPTTGIPSVYNDHSNPILKNIRTDILQN